MGRPRNPEPRDRQFNLCLTASELENIKRRAEAVGMRPAHYGRALLLNQESRPKARDGGPNQVADRNARLIYGELSRIGNNLNQLVRHLHMTGDPLPPDLEPLLRDIRQIIARGGRHDR